ncbi:twin-arginine translocase TatA/TatE family subunit [Deinococcus peraridilitoris]|uniref:Sec-independent protein translocase protein TatA n=1 Tax=Deinococcus peraridilitoris (strain DSM 19664 / LMG 22246 / CIP 109416 / KR-200) TaxID=937777 RepID=K9ZZ25_DEIPD|nr:twin-arginine translocase TatA/TatE family subunit [Deinococcus peraridilitoris]AFZ66157.1 twin arginine-targeting protein translocase, TatA/E family [Deinococcus peraridilitoris DSM 19664]
MGPLEIILIIVALLLLFGARKLPELGKGFGQGIREFKSGVKDDKDVSTADRRVETSKPEDRA